MLEKKTNEWALKMVGVERSLLTSVKNRKIVYFRHIMQKKEITQRKKSCKVQLRAPGLEADPRRHGCLTSHLGQGCQLNSC